jgi:hypothetical protein
MILIVSKPFYIDIIRELTHLSDHHNDIYEDDVNQRGAYSISEYSYLICLHFSSLSLFLDPVVCRISEDESQGEERDDDTDKQPTTPSRFQRQNPSRQGRVAYVIYGGIGNESGVYYNWYVVP